ncbi:AbiEi antitoxin N-terminal domain-containing protein [Paraburkholderia sp. BL25I1N1]|uniref:AbiEi antitoxin N-terminal domain-containing protein n=1 Tax=Paraburkholderia sp. BL25I1N1 TaxID=1938804 RepID=UPI000D0493C9|nr:hypothetical protein B0G73_11281 [Paraburkholderia sp. BL25I1N1]
MPALEGTVAFFARRIPGLHVSGKAALDMRGIRHYLYARPRINLWGAVPFEFPSWAEELLLLTYEYDHPFDDALAAGRTVRGWPGTS